MAHEGVWNESVDPHVQLKGAVSQLGSSLCKWVILFIGVVSVGTAVVAQDYHQGFWCMGYNLTADGTHLTSGEAVYVTANETLAFIGVTLDDVADCDFIGCGGGAYVGKQERYYNKARNVQMHRDTDGKLDLIVFDLPFRLPPAGGNFVKSLTIALKNGNGGVVAFVPDGNKSARSKTTNDGEDFAFVALDEDGKRSYQGDAQTLATSPTANGYGVAGLSAVRVVPVAQPGLVFRDCTLEEIRSHSFWGVSVGGSVNYPGPAIGCNKAVLEDANGKATKIRVEMQRIDGAYNRCVIVELTNGEGGVYAQNVAVRSAETTSYGFKFVNPDGSYAGDESVPSTGYPDAGYGVCGLTATDVPTTSPYIGFLGTKDKVLWAGQSLDRFVDFTAVHHGSWIPATSPATSRFYVRTGRGAETKIEFDSQSLMLQSGGTKEVRSGVVALGQKGDDIVGRVLRFAYGPGEADGLTSYLNGGTGVSTATGPTGEAYGLRDLEGRALDPVYTTSGDATSWSGLDWDYAANPNALAEMTITSGTFDFDLPVTVGMVRVNAGSDLTLTASGGSLAARYLDLTDTKGTTTLTFAPAEMSVTAGRNTVLAAAPVKCSLSVASGNRLAMENPTWLATCGLYARGSLKFTGNFDLSAPPSKDFGTAETVELAGTHVLTGCHVGKTDGFHWSSAGKLVISGTVTLNGGALDGKALDFCHAKSTAPGEIVVVEGGSLSCPERTRFLPQNTDNGRGALAIEGGVITGGWAYFNVAKNQQLDVRVAGGRFETGVCPWVDNKDNTVNLQLVQTGGTFAPSTLQPQNNGYYRCGSKSAYTFKGGVFEPPAGWDAAYPWLPITVPTEGDAKIRIVGDALIPSALKVAEGARLSVESTSPFQTLTLASLTGAGTLAVTGAVPVRLSFGDTSSAALEIAEGATFVKAGESTLSLVSAPTAGTAPGSLTVEGGTLHAPVPAAIGGTLSLAAGTTLSLNAGIQSLTNGQAVLIAERGIRMPDGANINDLATVTGGMLMLSDDKTKLQFIADANTPTVAVWSGLGNRALASDPNNWSCTNALGQALSPETGAVPTEQTTVYVTGATSFNLPADQTFACRELVIHGAITLTDDCDWRGLGKVSFAEGCTLDLAGHRLDVFGFGCPVVGAATITNAAEEEGALHVVVPEGQTSENDAVSITGNVKIFKDGEGTYQPNLAQTYTGGTTVNVGTFKFGTKDRPAGQNLTTITVLKDATLDMNDKYSTSTCIYNYALAGTIVQNSSSGTSYKDENQCFGPNFELLGDATVRGNHFHFGTPSADCITFVMNGHTLVIDSDAYSCIGAWRTSDWGTFEFKHGTLEWMKGYGPHTACVVVEKDAIFKVGGDFAVGDFRYDGTSWSKTTGYKGWVNVFGRYHAGSYRPPINLKSASTLDLNDCEGVFSFDGGDRACKSGENGGIFCADNATVTVDVSKRILPNGANRIKKNNAQIATWTTRPANVTFKLDDESTSKGYKLIVEDSGLRLFRPGICIMIM